MYEGVSTSAQIQDVETNNFPITIYLYKGSTISPFLLNLILDVLTKHVQEVALRCMLFADDIVLHKESNEDLNEWLKT